MREVKNIHPPRSIGAQTERVFAEGDKGIGEAYYDYRVSLQVPGGEVGNNIRIKFQNGPVEGGPMGVTNEALLAVVKDRLKSLGTGPLACRELSLALTHVEQALMWLKARTEDRLDREVENTSKP